MLDVLVIVIVLVFALLGFLRGILHGGLMIGALVLAYFASAALQTPLGGVVRSLHLVPSGLAFPVGRAVGGLLVFVSLAFAAHLADKRIGRTRQGMVVSWNRNLGALVGMLFGAGLSFCILCSADAFYKAYPDSEGWWTKRAGESQLRKLVTPINPADRWLLTDSLKLVRQVKEHPEKVGEVGENEVFQKLMDAPVIKAILDDEDLMDAFGRRDLKRIASDKKVRDLLSDPELRKLMFSEEMRAALKEIVEAEEPSGEQEPEAAEEDAYPSGAESAQ